VKLQASSATELSLFGIKFNFNSLYFIGLTFRHMHLGDGKGIPDRYKTQLDSALHRSSHYQRIIPEKSPPEDPFLLIWPSQALAT
jgi:hypothetical protein